MIKIICVLIILVSYHEFMYRSLTGKLHNAIVDRIALKDSVRKYEGMNDFIMGNHFRRLHADKTVVMELLFDARDDIF